jgi:hypothetical protein
MTLEEQIQAEIDEEKKTSSKPIEEKPPLEDVSIPVSTTGDQAKSSLVQVKSPSPEEPKTDVKGMTGAVTRGLTVPAAQALGGAILGSPLGPPGMAAGAAAGPIVFGLGDLAVEGVNAYFGTDFGTSRGAITKLLDSLGTPKPDTAAERITEAVTEGLASGGGSAAGFKKAGEIAKTGSKLQKVSEFMGQKPLEQLAIGGAASLASSGAQEAGAGPVVSTLAGLGAAVAVPTVRAGYRALKPTEASKQLEATKAVQELYGKVFPDEASRQKAIQQLREAGKITDEDVKLMAGDITGNPAMLALQRAMEKSSADVAQRGFENIQGAGRKITQGLGEVGAPAEAATKFFENEFNFLRQATKEAEDNLRLAGTSVSEEFNVAKKAVDDAEAAYQKGVINSEEAHKKARSALDDYFEKENTKITERRTGELSSQTADIIESQKNKAKEYASNLYNEIKDVQPFQQPQTSKAIEALLQRTPEGEGGKKDIPKVIRDIYANIKDEEGNLKIKELFEPLEFRKKINDEIDKAIRSGNKQEALKLGEVKKAIDLDLQSLEKAYPQIKRANQFYREYSDIYQSKVAEKAFKQGEDLTALLDKYGQSEEKLKNLRNSIFNHPEISNTEDAINLKNQGLGKIDEWIVGKAYQAMRKPVEGKKYTSASLKRWLNQGDGSVIFKVFGDDLQESKSTIENLISEFENLEKSAIKAKKNVDLAKAEKLTEGSPARVAYSEAEQAKKLIDASLEKEIKRLSQEFNEQTNSSLNPANKFIGGDAQEVVGNILSNAETSQSNIANILEAASKDTTGKAVEGVKNAARKWLNKETRLKSASTTTEGVADPVLLVDNLQADLAKMNGLLAEGSPQRKTLETLFGKDSKELAALDKSRQVIDMMTRKTTLSPQELLKRDIKPNDVTDTLLSVGAIGLGNVKGYVAWKSIDLIRKLNQNAKKDVGQIFGKMLAKSLTDPKTAEIMLQPINQQTWPTTKRLLRNFGIQARATDFGLEEEDDKKEEPKTKMGFGFASGGTFPKL